MNLVTLVCLIATTTCSVSTAWRVDVSHQMSGRLCAEVARVLRGDRALAALDGVYVRFQCASDDQMATELRE